MAKIISKPDYEKQKKSIVQQVKQGLVFIYPTDTIYGIGCDATKEKAVARIRLAKKREQKPFSVIAPSKAWIRRNCVLPQQAKAWIKKLPGPYTLILKVKNKRCIAPSVSLRSDSLGIRIPKNWSAQLAKTLGKPIVSTSANVTGEPFMTSLDNVNEHVKQHVDLIIYEGAKKARPSKLVDLREDKITVIKR